MNEVPLLPADASEILRLVETKSGLEQFIMLMVPGLVAMFLYDLRVPGERRKYGESILAIVVYSVLLDLIGLGAVVWFPRLPTALFIGGFVLLIPAIVGWFAVDGRKALAREGLALSPFPMAWDQLFRRLGSSDELYALVMTLTDGRRVGGIYDAQSFVSTYPADGDILIGAPCDVDQNSGLFLSRIATSYGLYVKRQDILAIEVRELKSAFVVNKEPGNEPAKLG